MAKIHQTKQHPNLNLPQGEDFSNLSTGKPVEEIKKKDYSTLSNTLFKKGELRLLHGDISGLCFFDMAIKLDPTNADLFHQQGLALFEYGSEEGNEKGLTLASQRFKIATKINPFSFEAWHAWGNTLYLLGIRKEEHSYFINAKKKYEKAIELSTEKPNDILADLYWDLGDLWSKLGEKSEEATDFHAALKAYEKASSYQDDFSSEFWLHYGHVSMKLGAQTNDLKLFVKAINYYKNAISITISSHEGWFHLGSALSSLYEHTHEEDHFSQASECFATAVQLKHNDSTIWLSWASLLLEGGKLFQDSKKLRSCIEKCEKGHECDFQNPYLMGIWAEALSSLGILTENLELLHEAVDKLENIPERHQSNPDICAAYGNCLMAFAQYFKETDYNYQAIEKIQEGLSIDRTNHKLWYAMALASFSSASLEPDEKDYERAHHFFEKALHLKTSSIYHFSYGVSLSKFAEITHDHEATQLAIHHIEQALHLQKNASYLHPDWIFQYACTLDLLGEFDENEAHYVKAIEIFNHVLILNPDFPKLHYHIALTYSHYGELVNEPDIFGRAFHHYRLAHQRDKENDQIILDWAITLVNLAELLENHNESDQIFREAEYKMIQSARLGNVHAYYYLACLYSLQDDTIHAIRFLEKALIFGGLPSRQDILDDEWLENLRETDAFRELLPKIESSIEEN